TAQFIVHVGMNMGLLPITGTTLPFMSYGGSHLLTEYLALGVLMGLRSRGSPAQAQREAGLVGLLNISDDGRCFWDNFTTCAFRCNDSRFDGIKHFADNRPGCTRARRIESGRFFFERKFLPAHDRFIYCVGKWLWWPDSFDNGSRD